MLGAAMSIRTIDRRKEKDNVQGVVVSARVALGRRNSYALQTFGNGCHEFIDKVVRALTSARRPPSRLCYCPGVELCKPSPIAQSLQLKGNGKCAPTTRIMRLNSATPRQSQYKMRG